MKAQHQENKPVEHQNPMLDTEFTQKVVQKAVGQQTLKDYLFMIVVGFRDTLLGFFQPKTLKHLDKSEPKQE
jgi:hypothetical protein